MVLDDINLQVCEAVHAFASFLGSFTNCVQATCIKAGPIEGDMRLFVTELEAFEFVHRP